MKYWKKRRQDLELQKRSRKSRQREDPGIGICFQWKQRGEKLLGAVSSGADDDIRQAIALARAIVAHWGMSSNIGRG